MKIESCHFQQTNPVLIIFIDGLSFEAAGKYSLPINKDHYPLFVRKLTPGIGYSSNLHWQIFKGLSPDKMKFFTDWNLSNKTTPNKQLSNKISVLDDNQLSSLFTRFLFRKLFGIKDNIPFSERCFFENQGKYLWTGEETEKIFGIRVEVIKKGNYLDAFTEASDLACFPRKKNLALIIEDLDHVGHQFGVGKSGKYFSTSNQILNDAFELIDLFLKENPKGRFVILSDHGFCDVKFLIDILQPIKQNFGESGKDYLIYCDSVYLRVWSGNEKLLGEINDFLREVPVLKCLPENQRINLGVTNRRFGDHIYVLQKGSIFSQNNFAIWFRQPPKGMHGYLEEDPDSSGVIISNSPLPQNLHVVNIFETLSDSLNSEVSE